MKISKIFLFIIIIISLIISANLIISKNADSASDENLNNLIKITNAEHLDKNKNLIKNIYSLVNSLDNVWSKSINDGEYIRITFEKNLTNKNDITIYPKIISGNPKIEVYEKNKNQLIAEFSSINSNEYNKVYLTNLQGEQDTFDLKIIDGSVEFDHIIDPYVEEWFEDCVDISDWVLEPSGGWAAGGGTCTSVAGAHENMTRQTDLTGKTNTLLNFGWSVKNTDAGEFFRVYVGTSTSTLRVVFEVQGTGASQSGSAGINITGNESSTTAIRFYCLSGNGENCDIDNINLTTFAPETTPPNLNITYPINGTTYTVNVSELNYSVSDDALQACWYSLDNGVTNITITCGNNATGLTSNEGSNTWSVWANDTNNNVNKSSVTFSKDTVADLFSVNISQAISITSTQTDIGGLFKSSTQGISLTSAQTDIGNIFKNLAQQFSLNEVGKRLAGLFRISSDVLNINGIVSKFLGIFKTTADTININGVTSRLAGLFRINSDIININGVTSRLVGIFKIPSDLFTFNLISGKSFGTARITAQQFNLNEMTSRIFGIVKFPSDLFNIGNSVNRLAGIFKIPSQLFNFNTAESQFAGRTRITIQQITFNDITNRFAGIFKIPFQLFNFNLFTNRNIGTNRATIQAITINDIANRLSGLFRAPFQTLSIGNAQNRFIGIFRINTNAININAITNRFKGLTKTTADAINLNAIAGRLGSLFRVQTQQISINPLGKVADGISEYIINLIQQININGITNRFIAIFKLPFQLFNLNVISGKSFGTARTTIQQISFNEITNRFVGIFKIPSDLFTFNVISGKSFGATRTTIQQISFNEVVSRFAGIFKLPFQLFNLNTAESQFTGRTRITIQQITFNEITNRFTGIFRINANIININQATNRFIGIFKAPAQAFNIGNAANRFAGIFKIPSQLFNLNVISGKSFGTARTTAQQITFNEITSRIYGIVKFPFQLFNFDLFTNRNIGAKRVSFEEISINSIAGRIAGLFKLPKDLLTFNIFTGKSYGTKRAAADAINLNAIAGRLGSLFRVQIQPISISNFVTRLSTGLNQYFVDLVQQININNLTNRVAGLFRIFSSVMQFIISIFSGMTDGTPPGSDGGSPGGGGGGGGSSILSPSPTERLTTETTYNLAENQKISFILGEGQVHSVTLLNIRGIIAELLVESSPQTVTLLLGQQKKFDFNNDNIYDVSIRLKSINLIRNKAEIVITPLEGAEKLSALQIYPDKIKVSLKQGETKKEELLIKNHGSDINVKIKFVDIEDFIKISETEFNLNSGQSKYLDIDFIAREDTTADIYLGKIILETENEQREILVAIDLSSKKALFDVKVKIFKNYLNIKNYLIGRSILEDDIIAEIQLFNNQEIGRVDAKLEYKIIDSSNNIIFQEDETLAIETQASFIRGFKMPNPKPGTYLLNVKVIYPINGEDVATSSAWLYIENESLSLINMVYIILIIAFILISIKKYAKIKKRNKHKFIWGNRVTISDLIRYKSTSFYKP